MSRSLLVAIARMAAAVVALIPLSLRAEEPKAPKVIASASDAGPFLVRLKKDGSGVILRSARELVAHSNKPDSETDTAVQQALTSELVKRLKVESIDWSKQMVLAVQGHPTRGEYGTVKFDSPTIEDRTLMVRWKQENRISRAVREGPPIGLCLVERFEGEVKFVPRDTTNSLGMNLVLIPAGKFIMGSAKNEEDRTDEEMEHEVEITRSIYLGKYEVTVGQFKAFVKETDYRTEAEKDGKGGRAFDGKEFIQKPEFNWQNLYFTQSDNDPVVVVTWVDAVAFCDWLSKKEGKTYRLPTEAEWEHACRAETKTRFSNGDKEDDLKTIANIADASLKVKWLDVTWTVSWDDKFAFTSPVGKFRPNAFGLHDMHGNCWEWCSDWYGEDYYRKSPKQDPQGPANGKERVARGGAWSTQPKFCRAAFRDWHEPSYRSDCVGFRVVQVLTK